MTLLNLRKMYIVHFKKIEDVFGKCEETILPEKDIDQSLNGKAVIEQSLKRKSV